MLAKSGAVVSGRYRLEEPLASGGMGTVWRAFHIELEVDVALKLLSSDLLRTPTGEKRFRREAQAAARLKSPHIVQVMDYGVFEDQPFLVMELLEGEDLATRISGGKLSVEECVAVMDGVGKALHVAHQQGIVHRDLKPGNIFLQRMGDDEIVKVLDFGIAKDLRAKAGTTGAALVGSPGYMSPEQVWADEVSVETDTWAMTLVAYEMLTQKNPFYHEVLAQMFDRIVKANVPSAREQSPELPASIDAFFARGLARKPSDRFSSAKLVVEALREALDLPSPPVGKARAPTSRPSAVDEASGTLAARVTKDALPAKPANHWLWAVLGVLVIAAVSFALFRPHSVEPLEAASGAASTPVGPSSTPEPMPATAKVQPSATPSALAPKPTPVPRIPKTTPVVSASSNRWGVPLP